MMAAEKSEQRESGSMKREFVITRHGKDYVLYAGLLDEAHAQGLKAIRTQLVQAPTPQNGQVAICVAEVTTDRGTFSGLGDASPDNVSRAMANALIRLAETRAKARALRDAINVSMVAVEELSEAAPESIAVDDPRERAERGNVTAPTELSAPPRLVALGPPPPTPLPAPTGQRPPPAPLPAASAPTGHTLPPGVVPLEAARPRRIRETPAGGTNANGSANGHGKAPQDTAPATPTQLETIAKLARSVGRPIPTDNLTRAAASDLITRLSEERYGPRRS
jgi:hypothetical protein